MWATKLRGGRRGAGTGARALWLGLRAFAGSRRARQVGGVDATPRGKTGGRRFPENRSPPSEYFPGAVSSPGAGLEISAHGLDCGGCQAHSIQDNSWWTLRPCWEQASEMILTTAPRIPQRAWPLGYQGIGALFSHRTDQGQTSHGGFVRTGSKKCQPLCASLGQPWFPRTQARRRCLIARGQPSTLAPRWPQELPPLVPGPRVGSTPSYHTTSHPAGVECHVVDLRSDTMTRPSPEMRQAMAQAEVGDDDYGEDPTVNELQRGVADLLGMEEALFVPTATMANLIAVMCHCRRRGAQVLLGREAHIHIFEQGGVAQVAGVHSETLQDLPDGTMDLDELEHKIQQAHGSKYHPRPKLICLENTHCSAGGRVLPLQYLQKVRQLAQQYGLQIHIDGARVLNAAVALGVRPSQIAQHCDSLSLCLSKGVGAPAGALLVGGRAFITEAWSVRKLLGGGMRQAGVLAAAALVGLNHVEETLKRDHENARCFAQGACAIASPLCSINLASVETNIILVRTLQPWLTPSKLCELMEAVSAEEVAATGQATSVRLFPWGKHCLRAVWHCDVSPRDTQLSGNKLRFVLDSCCKRQQPTGGP